MQPTSIPSINYIPSQGEHTATVIFIHGLGQITETWKGLLQKWVAPRLPHVRWILPQAPLRPVRMNKGQKRHSWFNISSLPPDTSEFDESSIEASVLLIRSIILSEVHSGTDSRRIVVIGFSQGAVITMMLALTNLIELGGLVSLCGWVPDIPPSQKQLLRPRFNFPVLWCHGTEDQEVPIGFGKAAMILLRDHMVWSENQLTFKAYPGLDHAVNEEMLDNLGDWLSIALD